MTKLVTPETEKALSLPLGAVSPLWFMFAGAAATGAAVFWARQWFKPVNLEALNPQPLPPEPPELEAVAIAEETVETVAEATVEVVEAVAETTVDTVQALADATVEVTEAVVEPVLEATPDVVDAVVETVEAAADDLTRLTGIGPKLAQSLAERGVTRFADIAAWTAADVEALDKDLKLMGRIDREAWIAQAKRYAEAPVH